MMIIRFRRGAIGYLLYKFCIGTLNCSEAMILLKWFESEDDYTSQVNKRIFPKEHQERYANMWLELEGLESKKIDPGILDTYWAEVQTSLLSLCTRLDPYLLSRNG